MSDSISRADAIDAVAEEWLSEASAESPYVNDSDIDRYRELAEELFSDIPSADTVSREFYEDAVKANIRILIENRKLKEQIESAEAVQGEWIEREDWNGDYYYDCSVCGESFVLCDGTPSMNLYHFCPNCGARMKGGAE